MLYIRNENTSPFFNQAFEQAVFELYTEEEILLVWRNAPAVVCGRNQNVFAELSLHEAHRAGVHIVRRDTGGGTVYHDLGNVNYTLICNSEGLTIDYDALITRAVSALNRIGVPAAKNRVCDIAIDGKKISGSAQRQTRERLLHHGTLLYDADLSALRSFSRGREGTKSKAVDSDRREVTNIANYKRFASAEDFAEQFAKACMPDEIISPTDELLSRARRLAEQKYSTWEWTYGKNPAFTCERKSGDISVRFAAKHGVITEFELCSPFAITDGSEFIGERLELYTIQRLCKNAVGDENAAKNLAEMIV